MAFSAMEPSANSTNASTKDAGKEVAKGAPLAPALGEYTDFRHYLKDVYDHRRVTEGTGLRAYSYSTFSAAADIKSPNYLKLIIEGRRNLSDDMISRFAKALRLNRSETEEFRALVRYGQASQPIERNQYLKELADLRAQRAFESGQINQRSWEKVPGWIGWVLYAMADQANVDFDPQALQRLFRAKAGSEDIRESLGKLIDSGELSRSAEGVMTMAMTEEEFQQVRFELRQMRKRLQKDISVKRKQSKGDRVYQLNVQLFPVTEKA
jgi:uncharacterized protein YjiS (DUF1127 family)